MSRCQSLGLLAVAAALTACTQVAALTPVGGDSITSVRNAAYDVLVAQGVDILVAPQCTTASTGFSCTGSTMDGREIAVSATSQAPYPMTVSVGGAVIFEGNAQDVLRQAADVTP